MTNEALIEEARKTLLVYIDSEFEDPDEWRLLLRCLNACVECAKPEGWQESWDSDLDGPVPSIMIVHEGQKGYEFFQSILSGEDDA